MKNILGDIHFAEAYCSLLPTDSLQKKTSNKNTDSLAVFYKQILDKNKVSITEFENALKWYSLHPQQLDTVYAKIMPVMDSIKAIPAKTQP